jgi:hypothetical protein
VLHYNDWYNSQCQVELLPIKIASSLLEFRDFRVF